MRQPVNIGAAPNHNATVALARGRYFKWASHDDVYGAELLRLCIAALEPRPDIVLAHSWDAFLDEHGAQSSNPCPYELETDDPRAPVRFRSLLHVSGGNDIYGVIRTDVLRSVGPAGQLPQRGPDVRGGAEPARAVLPGAARSCTSAGTTRSGPSAPPPAGCGRPTSTRAAPAGGGTR